ncbi:MAG: hypothetical protein KC419_08100 [Anaerolineales bacterium]|nr:hypothetical protein [Anaerolineales bacterium]
MSTELYTNWLTSWYNQKHTTLGSSVAHYQTMAGKHIRCSRAKRPSIVRG